MNFQKFQFFEKKFLKFTYYSIPLARFTSSVAEGVCKTSFLLVKAVQLPDAARLSRAFHDFRMVSEHEAFTDWPADVKQVWSITQFCSVDFLQSRISVLTERTQKKNWVSGKTWCEVRRNYSVESIARGGGELSYWSGSS